MTHAHRLTCRLKVRAHTTAHDAWVRCLNAHADALATWQNAQRPRAFQQIRRNLRVSRRVVQQVHEVKVGELAMKLQVEHGQRAPMQPAGSVLPVRSQRWPSEGRSALCRQLCGRSWVVESFRRCSRGGQLRTVLKLRLSGAVLCSCFLISRCPRVPTGRQEVLAVQSGACIHRATRRVVCHIPCAPACGGFCRSLSRS